MLKCMVGMVEFMIYNLMISDREGISEEVRQTVRG